MTSIQGKFSTLTAITEIGHGFFQCRDKKSAAMYICVQTQKLIPSNRSIITCKNTILAVSGQDRISDSSSLKVNIRHLVRNAGKSNKPSIHKGILEDSFILCVPLICPITKIRWNWLIELDKPETYRVAAELLAKQFSHGLLHIVKRHDHRRLIKSIMSLPFLLCTGFALSLIFVKLPEKTIAPVVVRALYSAAARSPLEGLVTFCIPEGSFVKKGSVLANIDVSEYQQGLEDALNTANELKIKINNAIKDSLTDSSKLIDIKLLGLEEKKLNLKISFLKKKVSFDSVKAPISGRIRYLPELSINGDSNVGRLIKAGEALCFIDDESKRVAEINLAESEISSLTKLSALDIYYHTSPDTSSASKILHIPPMPEISPLTQSYVYKIQASTNKSTGVTGTAHLRGQEVRLGYYLFKKIYFYLRDF